MSAEKMNAELEPALSLIPLVVAADTIMSYCNNTGSCLECPFHNYHCVGCYFEHTNPCDWDVNKIIGEMTEKIGKGHKTRPHRKEVKTA